MHGLTTIFLCFEVGGEGGKARRRGASDDHDDHVTKVTRAENELKDEINSNLIKLIKHGKFTTYTILPPTN